MDHISTIFHGFFSFITKFISKPTLSFLNGEIIYAWLVNSRCSMNNFLFTLISICTLITKDNIKYLYKKIPFEDYFNLIRIKGKQNFHQIIVSKVTWVLISCWIRKYTEGNNNRELDVLWSSLITTHFQETIIYSTEGILPRTVMRFWENSQSNNMPLKPKQCRY